MSKTEMFDDLGQLRHSTLLEKDSQRDFFQLSFNIWGIFLECDLKYKIMHILGSKHMSELSWKQGHKADYSLFKYGFFDSSEPIYFYKKDLHQKEFPITKPNNKHTEALSGLILLEHKPTHGNFWHFQFNVLDENKTQSITKGKGQWQKTTIEKFMLLYFPLYFKTNITEKCPLESNFYCKTRNKSDGNA